MKKYRCFYRATPKPFLATKPQPYFLLNIMQILEGTPPMNRGNASLKSMAATKAMGILGAIRAIMIGNVYGIALSAFRSRLKGKPIKKSSLLYEISMILSIIIFFPVAFIQTFHFKSI